MVVIVSIASPIVAWRSLAKPRIYVVISCKGSWDFSRRWSPAGWDRESSIERAMAFTREVEA
jgi:hypothetical protein